MEKKRTSYLSVVELKNIFNQQQLATNIFKTKDCNITIFKADEKRNEILIDIQTAIIGNNEVALFYKIYKWLKDNDFHKGTIYILLPEKFERFTSAFVSTLYLFNKGLGCEIAIYGHDNNDRVYEFIHLMYSGQLAPESDSFFRIITYNDTREAPKVWGIINKSSVNRYVVSKKNLPLIPVNEKNKENLFKTNLSAYLTKQTNMFSGGVKNDYKSLSEKFKDNYPIDGNDMKLFKDRYFVLHFYKLLDNLHCLENYATGENEQKENDEYYKKVKKEFIEPLSNLPIFHTIILTLLLDEETVRHNYIEIYNQIIDGTERRNNKTLVNLKKIQKKKKEEILNGYINFLNTQKQLASDIYNGIFELVKNTIEHSTNKRGVLTVRKISNNELLKIKNENEDVWGNYVQSLRELNFTEDGKTKSYLDISVVDDGDRGIIEKSLKELDDLGDKNKRTITKDVAIVDKKQIIKGLEGNESKLLYKMYFNPKEFFLTRQAYKAMGSYGLFIFTKFIHSNNGLFNINTNANDNKNETISFYSSEGKNNFNEQSSDCPFGTSYNIIIPIVKRDIPQKEGSNLDLQSNEITPPNTTFRQMLTFNPDWEKEKKYTYSELKKVKIETITDIKSNEDRITVFSLDEDDKVDSSGLLRTLFKALVIDKIDAIAVLNIEEKLLNSFLDLIYQLANIEQKLLPKGKAVFFYLKNEKNSLFVLAGENTDECININSTIKNNKIQTIHPHHNFKTNDKGKFPEHLYSKNNGEKPNPFFVNENLIIRFDFMEKQKNGLTKLEIKAKKALEKNIDNDEENADSSEDKKIGYKWSNTHLKIGSRLHLNDFVYGKKLFQKNYESSLFAYTLSLEIFLNLKKDISKLKDKNINYTLIGYGFYSELLVSRIKEFVKYLFEYTNLKNFGINYAIVKDEDEIKFSRFFKDLQARINKGVKENMSEKDKEDIRKNNKNDDEKIIIIVPISSTLTTCLKIENAFDKAVSDKINNNEDIGGKNRFRVLPPFYSVVVVGDGKEDDVVVGDGKEDEADKKLNTILSNYWSGFDKNKRIIKTTNRENQGKKENRYQLYLESKWQLVENCKNCFPEKNSLEEKPLFATDKVAVTPTLIFDPPSWYETKNESPYFQTHKDTEFNKKEKKYLSNEMLNVVHYKGQNKDFKYYLRYTEIVKKNQSFIEEWARKLHKRGNKDSLNPNKNITKKILLIAPDKSENGDFVHIINRCIFQERANIIKVDPYSDYYLNFAHFFGDEIKKADHIFFVDNLIATAKTFLYVANNLNIKFEGRKIEGVISLINRMDVEAYDKVSKTIGEESIYAFFNINAPVIVNPERFCPMCKEEDIYKDLVQNSSLDIIRQYFNTKELPYYTPIKKEDLVEGNTYNLENPKKSSVLKLLLTHYLNKAFFDNKEFVKILEGKDIKTASHYNFEGFVKEFKKYIESDKKCNLNNDIVNPLKLKSNIIKILSQYPFKRHRGIFIAVFYWVLKDLKYITDAVLESEQNEYKIFAGLENISPDKKTKIDKIDEFIDNLNYLRLLVKYAGILNIAYLLNKDFLKAINKVANSNIIKEWNKIAAIKEESKGLLDFNSDKIKTIKRMHYSIINFKIFCAAHISKSLQGVESRAIKFEVNINEVKKNAKEREDVSFLELLALENTRIIKEFIDNIDSITPENNSETTVIDSIEKNLKHDSKIKNYISFYKKSFNEEKLSESEIYKSNKFKTFTNNLVVLNEFTKEDENNSEDNAKTIPDFEENTRKLTKYVANVLGYDINKNSGGFFLYKYQNTKDKDSNTIILGKKGDTSLADLLENDLPENSLTRKMLDGFEYIKESNEHKEDIIYTWTNFTAYKDDNTDEWEGQNGCKVSSDWDIENIKKEAKRIIFYRISGFKKKKDAKNDNDNQLNGQAVFVFYDDQIPDDICSINRVRYIHVFRNKILEFFESKYGDDSFRAWLEQKEKNEYISSLKHGVKTYENSINHYMSRPKFHKCIFR